MTDNTTHWRERLKEKRREQQKQRRAALANDPRTLALKQALKERQRAYREEQKQRRKALGRERKARQHERAVHERTARDEALRGLVRPATSPDDHSS